LKPDGEDRRKYYFSNYVEVAREVKEIVNREVKARVFVFGSVVRGDYCVGLSDIDVAIVSCDLEDREKKLRVYSLLYEKCFESPLEFHLLTPRQWEFYLKLIGKDYIEV
jgi:predicted nucleotidyltransferase